MVGGIWCLVFLLKLCAGKRTKLINSLTPQRYSLKLSYINDHEKIEAKSSPYDKISDSNTIEHKFLLRSLEDVMAQRKTLCSERWSSDFGLLMNSLWRTVRNAIGGLLTVVWVFFWWGGG